LLSDPAAMDLQVLDDIYIDAWFVWVCVGSLILAWFRTLS
jgi:hypothetical protein